MFGLFTRTPRKAVPTRPASRRLMLEKLEERDCPSTITLTTRMMTGTKAVYFMGRVTNTPNPGGLTVQLSGVASGTATTSANGTFMVQLVASGLGTEYAATADGQSNTAQATLTDPAPTVDQFEWGEGAGGMFDFSGHVSGGYQGETVNLGGLYDLQGKTATLDASGDFNIYVVLNGQMNDNGNATARTRPTCGARRPTWPRTGYRSVSDIGNLF